MIIKDLPYLTELDKQDVVGGSMHGCVGIFADFSISNILEQYSHIFDVSVVVDEDIFAVTDKKDKTKKDKAKTFKASPKEDSSAKSGSGLIQSTSSSTDKFPK